MFAAGETDPHGPGQHTVDELDLAAAVLLVETARMDDTIDDDERGVIVELVRAKFELSDEAVSSVVELADEVAENAVELSRFTSRIRDGFDHDERSIFRDTVDFFRHVAIDSATIGILVPYPNTPLFQRLESEGRIITRDWSKYDGKK